MANSDAVQPLAQTFKNSSVGGCFLTSIDLYFAAKDATIPVWVEIRNVVSGAPGSADTVGWGLWGPWGG